MDRRQRAMQLLQGLERLISVERVDPPAAKSKEAAYASFIGRPLPKQVYWQACVDELAAHEFSSLVDDSVDFVKTLPNVENAHREDREVLFVYGTLEPAELRRRLTDWWLARLMDEYNRT